MIILLSKYNTLCDMFNMIQLQYNMAKNIMYLYLDSPICGSSTTSHCPGHVAPSIFQFILIDVYTASTISISGPPDLSKPPNPRAVKC